MRAGLLLTLLALSAPSWGQANYQRDSWHYYYGRYWHEANAPEPENTKFEVSKISPLPPYTRTKFNELWLAFREQYGVRQGLYVKWDWAENWLSNISYGSNNRPKVYGGTFEVVSGVGADGRPLAASIQVRHIRSESSGEENSRLDQDLRARAPRERNDFESTSCEMRLVDPQAPKSGRFRCTFEIVYERDQRPGRDYSYRTVYYEIAPLPDSQVNQTRFIEALKAGSQFRVILPKEVACRSCDGVGRPPGSRVLGAKCRGCGGSGKLRSAEICVVSW